MPTATGGNGIYVTPREAPGDRRPSARRRPPAPSWLACATAPAALALRRRPADLAGIRE
nr:hypothetical protein [Streptomyces hawaiiensis]